MLRNSSIRIIKKKPLIFLHAWSGKNRKIGWTKRLSPVIAGTRAILINKSATKATGQSSQEKAPVELCKVSWRSHGTPFGTPLQYELAKTGGGSTMKPQSRNREEMTFWQLIFSQSKANGAQYEGDMLPTCAWSWPSDTYLQRRRSLRQRRAMTSPTDYLYSEA
jgi:hypothetical protein